MGTHATDAIDPHRLRVAAHELGHAIAWHATGFQVAEIWIRGQGPSVHGHVWLDHTDDELTTVELERRYQAGLHAGRLAEQRWCEENDLCFGEHTCTQDMDILRNRRRREPGCLVPAGQAMGDAQRLIRVKWSRIARLTPALAAAGSLSPGRL